MKNLILAASMLASATVCAFSQSVSGPNGKLVIDVNMIDGKPVYTADYWDVRFLEESPLGLVTSLGDYTQGLELVEVTPVEEIRDSYNLPNIKATNVESVANTRTYRFAKDGNVVMDVIFNVKDCDFEFRYKLYPVGNTLTAKIEGEASGFTFPEGTTTFLCPQAEPMSGWRHTAPSYETEYEVDAPMGTNGNGFGFTFPCLFKHPVKGWILVSETGVDGSYCASHLDNKGGALYAIDYPDPREMNGLGFSGAAIHLPGYTPWRTVTFGHSLKPIMATTIPFDFLEPKYEPSKTYEYGKGTWSWIIKMDPSCNFDEQIRYIDFAADMGYQTVLVDALWDVQIGREKMEELAAYGKSKGVDLFVWYNSNGEWNDAPQGPHNRMNRPVERRREMQWLKDNGVRGIKVDFFGGDKQDMLKLYEDILVDANDYGIEVIFHGCTLPRGWERMYPNYVASEAVLASENLHFDQHFCDVEAFNATIHPLVRNTVGSMDFGGSALNKNYNANNTPGRGSQRRTSDVFALATAVMFQSPVQHFALAPNNLTDAPQWAIDFMKQVPTTWDEVRCIDGYPGRYLIMARRHGDRWYVAGVNAMDEPIDRTIKIPVLQAGQEVTLYSDDDALNGSVTTATVSPDQKLHLRIPTNGAVLIY